MSSRRRQPVAVLAATAIAASATAAGSLNAHSIWPENWARPTLQEFEQATGIEVHFVRVSSSEALARVIAEKDNPRVDVLFGGRVEPFPAGLKEGIFEPCKSPAFNALPARFKQMIAGFQEPDAGRVWIGART